MAEEASSNDEHFRTEVSRAADRVVVKLFGELDLATAPQLRETLVSIGSDLAIEVVLDLEELKFIDSVGLSVVIAEHKRLHASGGALVIQYPSTRTRKLFDVSGLSSYLTIRPIIVPNEMETER
jgi:anti-sigma B factor antagonist